MADNDDRLGAGEARGSGSRPGRGHLRIYLGSAAGVGKTYAMLSEGHRRAERGADVVVGFAETHGRRHTKVLTALSWLIACGAVVFLWQRPSSAFFGAAGAPGRRA